MKQNHHILSGTISIGTDSVVHRSQNSTNATVAKLLGREVRDGLEIVYLDRLIHETHHSELDGWALSGAISTVLQRPHLPEHSK